MLLLLTFSIAEIQCPVWTFLKNIKVHGSKDKYLPGDIVNFSCYDDYKLFGPGQVNCTKNWNWEPDAISVCRKDYGQIRGKHGY